MKLKEILSITFLLVMLTSYSQTTSTNINTIEKDTTYPVTNEQVNLSNNILNDLEGCIILLDSAYSRLNTCNQLQKDADKAINALAAENFNLGSQLSLTTTLLTDSEVKVKKQQKKIGRQKVIRNFLIGICASEAVAILIVKRDVFNR